MLLKLMLPRCRPLLPVVGLQRHHCGKRFRRHRFWRATFIRLTRTVFRFAECFLSFAAMMHIPTSMISFGGVASRNLFSLTRERTIITKRRQFVWYRGSSKFICFSTSVSNTAIRTLATEGWTSDNCGIRSLVISIISLPKRATSVVAHLLGPPTVATVGTKDTFHTVKAQSFSSGGCCNSSLLSGCCSKRDGRNDFAIRGLEE